jgi:hypothetical protein
MKHLNKYNRKLKLLALECIELLKKQLHLPNNEQPREQFAKGGSVGSLMDNGRIDQAIKRLSMKPVEQMHKMQQLRILLSEAGMLDEESQNKYLISILESEHELSPMEEKLLDDLYQDRRKFKGEKNNE